MIGEPDPPPSPRGARPRTAVDRARRIVPARYVGGLLLWQGAAWLVLAATGLTIWIATLPVDAGAGSHGIAVFWRSSELLAISVGASLGAAEIGMACRLRGGPRILLALALGLQGAALAAGLVVAVVLVMIAGSVLELLALSGAFLNSVASPRSPPMTRPWMIRAAAA